MMPIFDKLYAFMLRPFAITAYLLLALLSFFFLDLFLAEYFFKFKGSALFTGLYWYTQIGESTVYLLGLLLLAFIFRFVYKNRLWELRCWFLWLSLAFATSVCVFLKVLLGRARPHLWFNEQLYGFYGFHKNSLYWSFPSGHTTTMMSLAFAMAILFPRHGLWYILFGLSVAVSRIILTHHYLSDVAIAVALAFLEVALLRYVLKKGTNIDWGF